MNDSDDIPAKLARIARALERLAPFEAEQPDWTAYPAYVWSSGTVRALDAIAAQPLDLLTGIDSQKQALHANIRRHAHRLPAHDVLLWGARGMGKSALVKAVVADVRDTGPDVALVQAEVDRPDRLAGLFAALGQVDRPFLLFFDDIGFDSDGDGHSQSGARALRSLLDGGAMARPANVRLAVTSNRRAIVERQMRDQDDPVNPRDTLDDRLALADRFGLSLGFHNCSQDDYLAIISGYAAAHGLAFDKADALRWAHQRGHRSGRIAWHYVVELAGRAGKTLN